MSKTTLFEKLSVPVIPVCVFEEVDAALRVAGIVMECGYESLEVTLRTGKAFECIEAISERFPELVLGAGTVLERPEIERLLDLGVSYAISPCFNEELVSFSIENGINFIPGIATPTELFQALKYTTDIKVFPVEILGGVPFLKALSGPFRRYDFGFIPTGGVNDSNFIEYLEYEKVRACGMTWPVEKKLVDSGDYDTVKNRLKYILEEIEKN